MTSAEFVIWFRGFVDGAHDFNITPKQWDLIKEKLNEVNDNPLVSDPNTFTIHEPYNPYPYNPYPRPFHWTTSCGTINPTPPATTDKTLLND